MFERGRAIVSLPRGDWNHWVAHEVTLRSNRRLGRDNDVPVVTLLVSDCREIRWCRAGTQRFRRGDRPPGLGRQ